MAKLTAADFEAVVKATCPRCAGGEAPSFRPTTREYVHTKIARQWSQTLCLASFLMQSELNPMKVEPESTK